jgi:hypothetical protein
LVAFLDSIRNFLSRNISNTDNCNKDDSFSLALEYSFRVFCFEVITRFEFFVSQA